jgi:hypothetical protein
VPARPPRPHTPRLKDVCSSCLLSIVAPNVLSSLGSSVVSCSCAFGGCNNVCCAQGPRLHQRRTSALRNVGWLLDERLVEHLRAVTLRLRVTVCALEMTSLPDRVVAPGCGHNYRTEHVGFVGVRTPQTLVRWISSASRPSTPSWGGLCNELPDSLKGCHRRSSRLIATSTTPVRRHGALVIQRASALTI